MRRRVLFGPTGVHPRHPGLVLPVRVDPAGVTGPTPNQARGPRWRRTGPGLYVPAAIGLEQPEQRIVEAAQLLPGYGGVTGWAALRWQGGRWFDGRDQGGRHQRDVVLATMIHARPQPGVRFSEERLSHPEITMVDGLPLTVAARSVLFEVRYAESLRQAVRFLDLAAYDDLVSLAECHAYLPHLNGWTGVPQAREALAHADENCWSPTETDLRLVWTVVAGHPRPRSNPPLFTTDGRILGTPDLLDPEAGVVGEYDGAHHLDGDQRSVDVRREALFRSAGLEYVTMLAADRADPSHFVWRLEDCYRRALHLPEGRRAWTLRPPPWWVPTDTVAQRRALDDDQRARLLARRLG